MKEHVTPVDHDLLPFIHDPQDFKLAQHISFDYHDYKNADLVILGVPQDIGVLRNNGRIGARYGPDEIRKQFYKYQVTQDLLQLSILDIGNIIVNDDLESIHDRLEQVVIQVLKDQKRLIILGGGNDISYPDFKALAKTYKNPVGINIDKHFDVRDMRPINSGTPYRYLLEEEYLDPQFFYEIGFEDYANSFMYKQYLLEKGVNLYDLTRTREEGITNLLFNIHHSHKGNAFFYGLDLDSIQLTDAPGVSAPSPTGFTSNEIIAMMNLAGRFKETKIIEITEYNPKYDVDSRTARLASLAMYHFITSFAQHLHKPAIPLLEKQAIRNYN